MPKKEKILVVDDDQTVRGVLAEALELEGFSVDLAKTGQEAIEKNRENSYDIAIVDWSLPDIEGTKLLAELRNTTPKMAKILFTGFPSTDNAVDAVNKHADAFIIKSGNFEVLMQKIKELLKRQEEDRTYSEEKVAEFIETRTRELLETKA